MSRYKIYMDDNSITKISAYDYKVERTCDDWLSVTFFDEAGDAIGEFNLDSIIGWIRLSEAEKKKEEKIQKEVDAFQKYCAGQVAPDRVFEIMLEGEEES